MLQALLEKFWPVTLTPIIEGISITYDSNTETFTYENEIYHLKLGAKTYHPVQGILTLKLFYFERLNCFRAQAHYPLFATIEEAVHHLIKTKQHLEALVFVADHILDTSYADESALLKALGYVILPNYKPRSLEKGIEFLKHYSYYQTQEQRSNCFKLDAQLSFYQLRLTQTTTGQTYLFCNQNLAVQPHIIETTFVVSEAGQILAHYCFEPFTILNYTFSEFVKPYSALEKVTLINNKLYDLTPDQTMPLTCCPCCGAELIEDRCLNEQCRDKIIARAHRISQKDYLNVKGLSMNTLHALYDYLIGHQIMLEEKIDAYFFLKMPLPVVDQLGLKKEQATFLRESLFRARQKQKLAHLINSLEIEGIDLKAAKAISRLADYNIEKLIYAIEQANKTQTGLALFKPHVYQLKALKQAIAVIH